MIEEKEFERVGDSRSIKVDVRIISTTNRNLEEEVKKGNFREDLYYRLSVVPIRIPPLRERISDIPLLVNHFIKKYHRGKVPLRVAPEVMEHLKNCPWPGNIRELANVIQQMVVLSRDNMITMNDLPIHLFPQEINLPKKTGRVNLIKMVADLERKWILSKLEETEWNQEKAAKLLGITRKMLMNRMNKYQLKPKKEK